MMSESLRKAEKYYNGHKYEEARSLYIEILDGIESKSKRKDCLAETQACLHGNISRCYLKLHKPDGSYHHAQAYESLSPNSGKVMAYILFCLSLYIVCIYNCKYLLDRPKVINDH